MADDATPAPVSGIITSSRSIDLANVERMKRAFEPAWGYGIEVGQRVPTMQPISARRLACIGCGANAWLPSGRCSYCLS